MLDLALLFVRDKLDAHLRRRLGVSDTIVVLNHLRGRDDSQGERNQNRMVLTLVTLELETNRGFNSGSPQSTIKKNSPQRFNLNVLLSANFDDYVEALKVLSETILFFQATPVFYRETYPDLPQDLSGLQFEIDNTAEPKTRELWNMLGTAYLPSVLYKIRHLLMDAGQIGRTQTAVAHTDVAIRA